MGTTQRQVGDVLSELARDNYRGLIDPHTYRLQRAQLLDQLVFDDEEEASTTTRPQAPGADRRASNPPLSDPANLRRRDVDLVREKIETAEVLKIVDTARRKAREAAQAATEPKADEAQVTRTAPQPPQAAEPRPAQAPPAEGPSRLPLIVGGLAAVVVVAGLAMLFSG
ncbi:MAG: hypothetical protein AAGD86_06725, partial [Pseudomonadota bacterium]